MKQIACWLLKAFIAGVLAFVVLNSFCLVYYNTPFTLLSKTGMTNLINVPNRYYVYAIEGFGYGRVDRNGYFNPDEIAEVDYHDIIVMGSSHMEAIQMPQKKKLTYIMNEKLENMNIYNVGHSGHGFNICVQNFYNVIVAEQPKYVIIEANGVEFTDEAIQVVLDDALPRMTSPYGSGIANYIRQIPYFRLLYRQLTYLPGFPQEDTGPTVVPADNEQLASQELLNALLHKVGDTAKENNVKVIVFNHPTLSINEDGSVTPTTNPDALQDFSEACSNAGVIFVDMTDSFVETYNTSYILPHGFFNSQIGAGHLNVEGHRMVAEALIQVINELEAGN